MTSTYTFSELAAITQGKIYKHEAGELVDTLLLDSRKYSNTVKAIFFAIKGPHHNGHHFIEEMWRRGVRSFVIDRREKLPDLPAPVNILLVDNVTEALQKITARHRSRFHYPVVAITGSNGKTVVKEWLYQLLNGTYRIVRSPKSYNSQVGVPLSVWQMTDESDMAIFEAGISQPGEMKRLEQILKPDIGIFTTISTAHQESFDNLQQKIREKLLLFKDAKTLIYCRDQKEVAEEIERANPDKRNLIGWSFAKKAALQILSSTAGGSGTELQGLWNGRQVFVKLPFSDHASVENAIHCWVLMLHLEMPQEVIHSRMPQLTQVAMRLELLNGINGCTLINDVYNSDLYSLEIAIDLLMQQQQHLSKTLILSDISGSGVPPSRLYATVAQVLQTKQINRFFGIGPELNKFAPYFSFTESQFFPDTASFLAAIPRLHFMAESILIKGARKFGFERISTALQQKAHETILEINLSHLVHNLNYFRQKLTPGTAVMAMVKASSYGSGSIEIANVLQFNRVNYLGVAFADEGMELRQAGISLPIIVMNPETSAYDAMIGHDLEPQIYNLRTLEGFVRALKKQSVAGKWPIHLKLDSGMNRVGFSPDQIPQLLEILPGHPELEVKSVFSHLSGSDNPALDEFTRKQIRTFTTMADAIGAALNYQPMRHILNSSGISRFPEAQMDMVRLGIGMYGIGNDQHFLLPTSRLLTTISQVKTVKAGESVGYNRSELLTKDSRIAVIPIGYADGLNRSLGNRHGKVWVNGQFAPFAGSICMDMSMIDVTGIPCEEGDQVEVFGNHQSLSDFAKSLNTIEYEVLSTISHRVKRVYLQE